MYNTRNNTYCLDSIVEVWVVKSVLIEFELLPVAAVNRYRYYSKKNLAMNLSVSKHISNKLFNVTTQYLFEA